MDVRQLSAFVAVVDHETMTAAADALFVSQPALSQTIRNLERDLGIDLFDRVGRNVRLTAAGRALLPGARQALRDVAIARDAVESIKGVRGGRLDLVSIPTLGVDPVARFVGEFHRQFPDVVVRLLEPDSVATLGAMVAEGDAEIGFTELPLPSAALNDRLIETELEHQEYVFVHHRSVELDEVHVPDGAPVPLPEVASLPLVTTVIGTSTRRLVDEAFDIVGMRPRIGIETELREVISAIVSAGGGYSILPRTVAASIAASNPEVRVLDVVPPITRRVGLIRRAGALSPAGRSFLDIVERSQPSD